MEVRLPNDEQRHAIVGATGSGKTQAALWHLSHRNFHQMPWLIYNFKRDESIDAIPGATPIELDEVPEGPGVYIAHPLPHEQEQVENQLWNVWYRGETGVYVDEGYMLGNRNDAFRALLTQGRSKRIPMIVLSQRPVQMDRFVFSESDFHQVFRLNDRRDRKIAGEFVPIDLERKLAPYHSYYYDVGADKSAIMAPVPDIRTIHSTFARRFARRRAV